MNRIPPSPPPINPRPPAEQRPQWSVMIPVFNCARHLSETLTSVLTQDPGPDRMQIEVVDDASTDADVAALVAEIGRGRVQYVRQPANVGSLRTFETCLNRAQGHFVHLLHGDDRVHSGYYEAMTALFEQYPQAGAAFCRHEHVDESGRRVALEQAETTHDGVLPDWLTRIAIRQRIQYCSIAVKRAVYEKLGGFYGVAYGEDWEMWVRIAQQYPVAYTPRILAAYRLHPDSVSGQSIRTGQNLRDLQWVIQTIQAYLPAADRDKLRRRSLKHYAHYGLDTAERIWQHSADREGVRAQLHEATRMYRSVYVYVRVARLYGKIRLNRR